MSECDSPESKLAEALAQCERLREENRLLRDRLKLPARESATPPPAEPAPVGLVTAKSSPKGKVVLFRSLFRGREDVHAVRWEGRNGKAGYSPASRRVWGGPNPPDSESPREYLPLTDQVLHDHLTGRITAGVYPMLTDETCWFLAADFDKATWQEDVWAYLHTCIEWNVPALLERSRSGRGGHVWLFFAAPLPARLARKLGAATLTRTMEGRHHLGLDSYDRFFPSQDTMPKGGFGNLIALPLQAVPRGHGNSVFLDAEFQPYDDQWSLLSGVRRMGLGEVESLVAEAERTGDLIGVRHSATDEDGIEDLLACIRSGRSPILLAERTRQVDEFVSRIGTLVRHVVVLKGGMGVKRRRAVAEQLKAIPDGEERVLLATGRYIGEGFDDARLDTLFLATPISWRGTLQQ